MYCSGAEKGCSELVLHMVASVVARGTKMLVRAHARTHTRAHAHRHRGGRCTPPKHRSSGHCPKHHVYRYGCAQAKTDVFRLIDSACTVQGLQKGVQNWCCTWSHMSSHMSPKCWCAHARTTRAHHPRADIAMSWCIRATTATHLRNTVL